MGRHDAYSYHSESGTADGTPGQEREGPVMSEEECDECGEVKRSVVSRAGSFDNRMLCTSCVNTLQEEELSQKHAKALNTIRGE